MVSVAVGSMALIVVLSVFNGLEDLLRSLHSSFDPEIKITAAQGKSFQRNDSLLAMVSQVQGVALVTEVIEDNAYVRYKKAEMVVKLKGVSDNFLAEDRLKNNMVLGEFKLHDGQNNYAIIGRGVQIMLSINPSNELNTLKVFYPRNVKPNSLNPSRLVKQQNILPAGIFAIEKQYDENYIFVPLQFAEELFSYQGKRTAIEVKTSVGANITKVQQRLEQTLGSKYLVLNQDQQHSSLLKAIKIEKLFVFIAFTFILAVASFNIFFSLTMLAIDKKKDISVLYALGAQDKTIKKIFLSEGALIAFIGAALGLLLGFTLCFIQQTFGVVPMGMQTAVSDAYPVKMQALDFVTAAASIIIITFVASYRPAVISTKVKTIDYL